MQKKTKDIFLFIGVFMGAVVIGLNIGISRLHLSAVNTIKETGNMVIKKSVDVTKVEYEVMYLKKGKLYVKRVNTGELIAMDNQVLIKQALRGKIRQGDIIRL